MKKLLSLLLAMMMLALPVLAEDTVGIIGGADGPTSILTTKTDDMAQAALDAGRRIDYKVTVSDLHGLETGAEDIDAAIRDVLNALSLVFGMQGEERDFALNLNETGILTYGQATSGEDVYMNSNLLGGTIVVAPDEVELLFGRLMDMFVAMEAMPQEEADELKVVFSETYNTVLSSNAMDQLTVEDLLDMDYTALLDLVTVMADKVETVEPSAGPSCDPAVAGYALSITDAEMKDVARALLRFIRANPELQQSITSVTTPTGEVMTEVEDWDELLTQAEAEIDSAEMTGAVIDVLVYVDADGLPTFISITTPVTASGYVTVSGVDENGQPFSNRTGSSFETEAQFTLMRTTLAETVSYAVHAATFDKNEAGETIADTLNTVLKATINVKGNALDARIVLTPDEENVLNMDVTAAWEQSETRELLDLVIDAVSEYAPEETEIMSVGGVKLPGAEKYAAKAETNHVVLKIASDYAITGVDFEGATTVSLDVNGIGGAITLNAATADPVTSIMAGNVVRPAELDDTAFAEWFVDVINGLGVWLGDIVMALPESVLPLLGM